MAELVVPYVIDRIDDVLNQEYTELKVVRKKLDLIRRQFLNILRTVQATGSKNPSIMHLAADIREAAYELDDVLDKFYLKIVSKKDRESNKVMLFLVKPKKAWTVYNMGKKLEAIFHKIGRISPERSGITINSTEKGKGGDASYIRLDSGYVIFHKEDVKPLVELLKVEEPLRVVPICSMGGIGKTTIAKCAFSDEGIQEHFEYSAWACVSQHFKAEDVLRKILRADVGFSENEHLARMKEVELVEKVYAALEKKRFLVVLDDIWSMEAWKVLQSAFPPNGIKGSKVVLTTRNKNLAAEADPHRHPFVPRFLNDKEAWDMLSTSLFPQRYIPADLESCGQEMVKDCGGLPLAIILLSRILATKHDSLLKWQVVAKAVGWHVSQAETGRLYSTLMLSYDDLPYHLKPCFLYMGIFPKSYCIPAKLLIQMWIEEGFVNIRHGDHLSLEDVGRQFLNDLIQRSLIQVVETDLEGGVMTCQLHDMMRHGCIRKAREEKFFEVSESCMPYTSADTLSSLRRWAIHLDEERFVFTQPLASSLRSLILFNSPTNIFSSSIEAHYNFVKRIRVLELNGNRFPNVEVLSNFKCVIGRLLHLRYLGLRDTGLDKLPNSIGNLVCLRTLDVRKNSSCKLPNVIWKLKELRSLYIDSGRCGENAPLRINTLRKLQVASRITARSWESDMFTFTSLQKLDINELEAYNVEQVIKSIVHGLDSLESLSLQMSPNSPFPDLKPLSKQHHLLKLSLSGQIGSIPTEYPSNVVKLRMSDSRLYQDPMPLLGNLKKLRHLELLSNAYLGKEMVCSAMAFPRLLSLSISDLPLWEVWTVEKHTMPYLMSCDIHDCKNLKMIPQGFQHITSLQNIKIVGMPNLEPSVQGGQDWRSVQHIPRVTVYQ